MESEFKPGRIDNVLQILCDEQALLFLGLSTACNDLMINLDAIGKFPISDNSYFFYSSIAIVRELALLVVKIEKANFLGSTSETSKKLFEELHLGLSSFEDESLVKSTLKPIRDLTFHYNFGSSSQRKAIVSLLHRLRNEEKLDVGLKAGVENPLGQRYTFADNFRSEIVNQFLSKEIVSKISVIAVNAGCFVDSAISDLLEKQKQK